MILANEEAQTRPYQHYVTVCLSVPPTKQFWEAPVVMVQWFVCLSVAMATSQGNGYGTQSIMERGGLQNGKIGSLKPFVPPPSGQGETIHAPTPSRLKGENL